LISRINSENYYNTIDLQDTKRFRTAADGSLCLCPPPEEPAMGDVPLKTVIAKVWLSRITISAENKLCGYFGLYININCINFLG
jgi:hypothetical protein